ncbi:flagellar protein FlaG [Pectinatus brassicae]|uniref:Flagellar protein FlaG n=1 Tax=Pectinatus brassicae TaxID=862415 RepID=A0A840UGF3_9FIRM|nr:flagellar protein FlaG [Pectinatus brassicae]MBB5336831.1 flagellar protein FlaG [Pectinatus brassicae]
MMIDKIANNASKNLTTTNTNISFNQIKTNNNIDNNISETAQVSETNTATDQIDKFIDDKKNNKQKLSDEDVKKLTDKLNKEMSEMNLELKFTWYEDLDQLGVKMIDSSTQKTIKSFPPEEVMKTLVKTKKWLGKLLDKNV